MLLSTNPTVIKHWVTKREGEIGVRSQKKIIKKKEMPPVFNARITSRIEKRKQSPALVWIRYTTGSGKERVIRRMSISCFEAYS